MGKETVKPPMGFSTSDVVMATMLPPEGQGLHGVVEEPLNSGSKDFFVALFGMVALTMRTPPRDSVSLPLTSALIFDRARNKGRIVLKDA
jgi:hypothetical protein